MALELAFNIGMLLFFIYCFIYVGVTAPEKIPGQMDGAQWPQILLGLLVIFLAMNIYKVYKNRKDGETFNINFDIKEFVKNKLFIGSVLLIVYTLALDFTGFIVTSIIFFMLYSRLLGEKRVKTLLLSSVISVVTLYVMFNIMLSIMLPRGIGIFRTFALFLESII